MIITRVLVDRQGLGVRPGRARDVYGIQPEWAFVRFDGWILGAPNKLYDVALRMWHWDRIVKLKRREGLEGEE